MQIWNCSNGNTQDYSPAVANGYVYVFNAYYMDYLNATSGLLIWNLTMSNFFTSSPAIADGCIYIGSLDFNVYCLPMQPATFPAAPQLTSVIGGNNKVTLTWASPVNNGGIPILNYTIYRSSTTGAESSYITLGNVTSYVDTNVTNGQTVYYKISAINGIGKGSNSTEMFATPGTTPSGPVMYSPLSGDDQIFLNWSIPANNGGSPIINYSIYRGTSSNNETFYLSVGNTTTYLDTGLTSALTYYYEVSAMIKQLRSRYVNKKNMSLRDILLEVEEFFHLGDSDEPNETTSEDWSVFGEMTMTSNTGYCYWYYWVWILMSAVAWIGCIHEGWGDYFRAFLLLCNNQSPYLSKGFVYGYGFWLLLPCFLNQWEYYGICVIIGVIDWSLLGPVLTTKQLGFLLCLVGLGDLIAQNCMAILLLLTIIAWRSQKNHPYWAGLIMGFCLFKPSVVLILPFFCLKDQHIQWITCFGVMVGILGNYLPVVMFGQVFSFFDNILSAAGFSSLIFRML